MRTEEETVSFIKWNTKLELVDLLKGYTKNDLLRLADNQAITVKKSWNKSKIVNSLAEKITEQAETLYQDILADVLTRLPDLETHVYRVNELADIQGFIPLILKGFFFVTKEDNGLLLLIPEEIMFSVKDRAYSLDNVSNTESTINSDNAKKSQLLNQWKEKTMAIYGQVSLEHLRTTWNRCFEEPITVEEIEALLD